MSYYKVIKNINFKSVTIRRMKTIQQVQISLEYWTTGDQFY